MTIINPKMTETFIKVGGLRLWTIVQGRGIPVLLCSGPGCCDYLSPIAGMLDDLCQVGDSITVAAVAPTKLNSIRWKRVLRIWRRVRNTTA